MEIWFNGKPLHRVAEEFFVPASDIGAAPSLLGQPNWTADDADWLAANGIA